MSAQSSLIWTGFWPIGDRYPLEASWSDLHFAQGRIADAETEALITQEWVIPYGFPWSVTISLLDQGADAEDEADDLPQTGYVRTESKLWRGHGWDTALHFDAEPVMEDDVWTGDVVLSVPVPMQDELGFNESWSFFVRVVLDPPDDALDAFPVYVGVGTIAVRP